jgi:hypothetical protein
VLEGPYSRQSASVYRRRRAVALVALAAVLIGVGLVTRAVLVGDGEGAQDPGAADATRAGAAQASPPPPSPPQLPRGGRRLFPDFRVVAIYGAPQAEELGALGIGTPDEAGRRLARIAAPYARKTRPVLPAMELLATIVSSAPGDDGLYRYRQTSGTIRRFLRAARRRKALLLLDIQPGRADFLSEARAVRRWLREPDVGIALDPEWRMGPGQVPGQVIGSVTAAEVNRVSAYVAGIVRRYDLPEKLFVLHQFTQDMIADKGSVRRRPGLAITMNVDGFGTPAQKIDKYEAFTSEAVRFHDGFKLFFREDTDRMSPSEVLRLGPPPDLVVYE